MLGSSQGSLHMKFRDHYTGSAWGPYVLPGKAASREAAFPTLQSLQLQICVLSLVLLVILQELLSEKEQIILGNFLFDNFSV